MRLFQKMLSKVSRRFPKQQLDVAMNDALQSKAYTCSINLDVT